MPPSSSTIGQRNTWQRKSVIELLAKCSQPVSAEHIHASLCEEGKTLSLSTVYRTLNALADCHKVHLIPSADANRSLFTLHGKRCNTHVVICRSCGREEPLKDCPVHDTAGTLVNDSFLVECHHLELRGICGQCRNEREAA